ncbi:hypothetical protein KUW19_00685 [Ferrimonas balearica]|uniref:hypothetical protein n=1 Tax=Ferrimonas balearica TaxID=44012 RepID=UPI001C98868A|nr:hypothetical protein [Ferrimonas balearica]MBY6104992.1 hypothetical protein [Ferrimonas balearica]
MDTKQMQALIDTVAATGESHELESGIYLVRGDNLIAEQKDWDESDPAKNATFNPAAVYWWGDGVTLADAEDLAECY